MRKGLEVLSATVEDTKASLRVFIACKGVVLRCIVLCFVCAVLTDVCGYYARPRICRVDKGQTNHACVSLITNIGIPIPQADLLELSKHGRILTTKKQERFKWIQERVSARVFRH